MIDLSGETAIVTGGSRGIGRAACLLLAAAGADIVVGYHRNEEAARSVVEQITGLGRRAVPVGGDAAEEATVSRLLETAERRLAPAKIVVGNAGIWKGAAIQEMTPRQWEETLRTNLTSVYHLCHQAADRWLEQGIRGRIVLISSTAGQRGEAGYAHYAATKAGIIGLTKSLGAELGRAGIRINAVAPGWVETDMVADVFADPARRAEITAQIPLGRVAEPEEIAGAVLFLVSDLARHVQGEVLNVNGGSVMCG